jgi:hypothetical protein
MHPLIFRFIDLKNAVEALEGSAVSPDEKALQNAGEALPNSKSMVLSAKGKKSAPPAVQEHLIVLASHAAGLRLLEHETLGLKAHAVLKALIKEGATAEDAHAILAQTALEEAFGYSTDIDSFDAEFVAETLETWLNLAGVTQETVDALIESFVKNEKQDQPQRLAVAETLLASAWAQGPASLNPESLDEALDSLLAGETSGSFPKILVLVEQFLKHLNNHKLLGKERLSRLVSIARSAQNIAEDPVEDDDLESDEDEA